MRIPRLLVLGALTLAFVGTASAASADEVPAEPPPVVDPPAESPPPPPSEPVIPPEIPPTNDVVPSVPPAPPTDIDETHPLHVSNGASQLRAHVEKYGLASMNYLLSHPGGSINFDTSTGLFTDANGAAVDLSAYGQIADQTVPTVEVVQPTDFEEFVVEFEFFDSLALGPESEDASLSDTDTLALMALEVTPDDQDDSGSTIAAFISWGAAAAVVLWRKRGSFIALLRTPRI